MAVVCNALRQASVAPCGSAVQAMGSSPFHLRNTPAENGTAMTVYQVPGMTLIPQKMAMSCWYASAQMLIQWRQDRVQQSLAWLVPPDLDVQCAQIRDGNNGIQNSQILDMARRIGLKAVPPMSVTIDTILNWLRSYGPLWVNGRSHIVVIAGVDTEKRLVKVYDPSPVNVGKIDWRSWDTWYESGTSVSTRDTSSGVETVFLYVPAHQPIQPFSQSVFR